MTSRILTLLQVLGAGGAVFFDAPRALAGPPTQNGDETVTDTCTGLMWQQSTGNDEIGLTWCEALTYAENLNPGGEEDWRLPNIRELESLIHYDQHGQIIDAAFAELPGDNDNGYWSSTPYVFPLGSSNDDNAWYAKFCDSTINFPGKSGLYNVRAVRGLP